MPRPPIHRMRRAQAAGVILGLAAGLWLNVKPASAHRLAQARPQGVTPIDDAAVSYAFYQTLARDQVALYSLTVAAGDRLHVAINVPQIAGLERYGVTVALLGPGLPALAEGDVPAAARRQVSGPLTGLVAPTVETGSFHEHFTQTDYWKRQTIDLPAPAAGSYTVAIWHPDGASGKYVLSTGYKEVFGPLDLLRFPGWWWQVRRYFGQFGGRGV